MVLAPSIDICVMFRKRAERFLRKYYLICSTNLEQSMTGHINVTTLQINFSARSLPQISFLEVFTFLTKLFINQIMAILICLYSRDNQIALTCLLAISRLVSHQEVDCVTLPIFHIKSSLQLRPYHIYFF